MKKLAITFLLFFLPTFAYLAIEENYLLHYSTFALKKIFIENNLNKVELLVLGSSHNQSVIKPAYIDVTTANLATGEQAISIEYLNYKLDKNYNVRDFVNDNHLNSNGGTKFTKQLNDKLFKKSTVN